MRILISEHFVQLSKRTHELTSRHLTTVRQLRSCSVAGPASVPAMNGLVPSMLCEAYLAHHLPHAICRWQLPHIASLGMGR